MPEPVVTSAAPSVSLPHRARHLGMALVVGVIGVCGLTFMAAHLLGVAPGPEGGPRGVATEPIRRPVPEFAQFEPLLAKHRDLTYDQLLAKLGKPRSYLQQLSFDPTTAKYYDVVKDKMALTPAEIDLLKKNGLVSIDQNQRHSFASAYFHAFVQDLPVFVTSDSILHALHRSYDDILRELEMTLFTWTIGSILEESHGLVAERAARNQDGTLASSYRDLDLYLTVARNLLAGAGTPAGEEPEDGYLWNGELLVRSKLGSDDEALARLKDIRSLRIQVPRQSEPTVIYGGSRYLDYSQFRPRGHYTKNATLKRYFRAMMWLGRADCGWNVLPPAPGSGVQVDADRELRDAILLVEVLQAGEGLKRLRALDDIINFMVGRSDNLTVFGLRDLLAETGLRTLSEAAEPQAFDRIKKSLAAGKHARPMIRSQVLLSGSPGSQVPPPAVFQMFGQRFVIDSFVLSQVVYDSILFKDERQRRMMPRGLDAMAALGNDEAVPLLKSDLEQWNYSGNLMACREFTSSLEPAFWKDNLYNVWVDAIRTLDDDLSAQKHLPEVMRTQTWQRKQLQTQLGSWSELRHDTILYAKQSYSTASCEYPAGYVEPYPEFYAKLRFFAEEAGRLLGKADLRTPDKHRNEQLQAMRERQTGFFKNMAQTLGKLETLARKELKAEPFSKEERDFFKTLIRSAGCVAGQWDGWYCQLFYNAFDDAWWAPTIADVHTDPDSQTCLQVGVGDANFLVIAVDNDKDRAVYVGPVYSYYEFAHPVSDRLTDERWQQMIQNGRLPPRPEWISSFQAPTRARAR
jgi:hypothetical protein